MTLFFPFSKLILRFPPSSLPPSAVMILTDLPIPPYLTTLFSPKRSPVFPFCASSLSACLFTGQAPLLLMPEQRRIQEYNDILGFRRGFYVETTSCSPLYNSSYCLGIILDFRAERFSRFLARLSHESLLNSILLFV